MENLSFGARLWLALILPFKLLFDGRFAARVAGVRELPEASPPPQPAPKASEDAPDEPAIAAIDAEVDPTPALQLLAILQREGRFIDFIEEDVASFSDADIGAAARIVHSGCRKALREHVKLEPVRSEDEGAKVTLDGSPQEVKLTGNVQGKGPHTGTLRHRGWRAVDITLPVAVEGHDVKIVAQAEVEL